MVEHWRDFPPVHVSVALYLGLGGRSKPKKKPDGNLGELISMFGARPGQDAVLKAG
jgi:hypothetical protein